MDPDVPEGPAPSDAIRIPVQVTKPSAPNAETRASIAEMLLVGDRRFGTRTTSWLSDSEIRSRIPE
jgi:hypothetical protein